MSQPTGPSSRSKSSPARERFDFTRGHRRRSQLPSPSMAMWRCPHCATPQAETSRCWVCKRSSTSCATCRNYRVSVAPGIGYCGLDRRRLPLVGNELRPCWEAAAERVHVEAAPPSTAPHAGSGVPSGDDRPRLDFVPVGEAPRETLDAATTGSHDRKRRSPTSPRLSPPPAKVPVVGVATRIGLWDETGVAGPGPPGGPT